MNVTVRRVYRIELDVWEPTQKAAEREIDSVIRELKTRLHHCGNVHTTLISEERV